MKLEFLANKETLELLVMTVSMVSMVPRVSKALKVHLAHRDRREKPELRVKPEPKERLVLSEIRETLEHKVTVDSNYGSRNIPRWYPIIHFVLVHGV